MERQDASSTGAKFCSQCGRRAQGNFCSGCGHSLNAAADDVSDVVLTIEWRDEIRYEVIASVPEVQQRLSQAAKQVKKGLSGEQVLSLAENLTPGVPMEKLAGIVQPLYASWGVKTGKERSDVVAAPVGEAIVRVLSSLARRGQEVLSVEQHDDGCTVTATLPSDVWALGGKMTVTVRRDERGAQIDAATLIEGQWIDWGKSKRRLELLLSDVRAAA
ncbi:hypothetical protein Pla108_02230 [Botrimarina colliarenosi]|uniref:Zinc-ribbon domain-containing protein n=1 Tax=Botrimarina colliarenosi TaxID=2528001 RepID=A0A5C6AJ66_9BACT|nr:zinc ribbon domain-containing protein [Botrimarina colliarenosi]TWT99288.1 hypothetical protein Pla108_02230 [Botrimarina colliarenosi]